jgi:hypothetical protein
MTISPSEHFNDKIPPVQLIAMGCPGSGKSFELKRMATVDKEFLIRTTFHQELSYGDFVGAYKPVPLYLFTGQTLYDADHTEIMNKDSNGIQDRRAGKVPLVMYDYRPGPFINALLKAALNPERSVVLLIEEINRANPAAVFGDILQLLDRGDDGWSEYPIEPSDDLKSFLIGKLTAKYPDDASAMAHNLRLPPNLYIWGTMNRADESVNYIDSAILRRWSLLYLPYDTPSEYGDVLLSVNGETTSWDSFRKKINDKLASTIEGIEDDKFIGPYFLKKSEIDDPNRVFSKLITYLWHDVVPMERDQIFDGKSLSLIYQKWMAGKPVLKI